MKYMGRVCPTYLNFRILIVILGQFHKCGECDGYGWVAHSQAFGGSGRGGFSAAAIAMAVVRYSQKSYE